METSNLTTSCGFMTTYEIIACIFSLLSVIFSCYSIYCAKKKKNTERIYYDLFKNYIIERIPCAYKDFEKPEDKASQKNFEEVIRDFRRSILAVEFINKKFYKEIDDLLIQIDEKIVVMNNRTENFGKLREDLYSIICELYKKVNKFFG